MSILAPSFPAKGTYAPVAVFAYRRPAHLSATIESLRANPEAAATHLHVFCDGPGKPEHAPAVQEVRDFADSIAGFASIRVVKRESNLGLAGNIIDGVSGLTKAYGRVIVVEDDLLLSPHFLRYMNDALNCYADDPQVASIHGYSYPVDEPLPETFFLRGADCWGWATWRRAWLHFRADGAALLQELQARKLSRDFDLDGRFRFTRMLRNQIAGRNDSWAVRWHASCYLAGLLTLYPGRSLVHNIGNDDSGTHCDDRDDYVQRVAQSPVNVKRQALQVSEAGRSAFVRFFEARKAGPVKQVARVLQRLIRGSP